ncbi:MAG TPA: transcription elongation factor GreA [Burkholderiaceae bacterium]|jgi:transcription elongation factor GreA|nr:transcription elongation factor GreA [Rhodoferax sp.]HPW07831.1 transcription elongation factor GreA [Burkholderiaceae bacterium]
MATIPITKRGAEKLKAELHKLKTVDRPWVIGAIAEARAQGDLSENAEYEAAKDRQGFIEGRIQEVEGKLSAAQIIDPASVDAGGKVVFGTTVELEDESTGDVVKYQIVGEDEADLKLGLINIGSPIARALIGKEVGDTAEVQAPGGVKHFEVIAVHYV